MVFFDLPVKESKDRKAYQKFRQFLIEDGYDMIQYSVYTRLCSGYDASQKHLIRLNKNLPSKGSVRALTITEKQYIGMKFLVGEPTPNEKKAKQDAEMQLSFF